MEYEIAEENLLFDQATSNPSLAPARRMVDLRKPWRHQRPEREGKQLG